jgi:hypothetical protein
MTSTSSRVQPFSVTQQYARRDAAMVYGRFQAQDYALATPAEKAGGCPVPGGLSATEAFCLAGCAFPVEKRPVLVPLADGRQGAATEHCAIVRSDTGAVLGIHGSSYTPVQQQAMVDLLDFLREEIQLENVLSIRGGQMIVATASIGLDEAITPGDAIRRYLHLCNSHDGSSAFSVAWSSQRLYTAPINLTT